MKNTITVVIHTHNESTHIAECIESAKNLTDQIILIDTESTDDTVAIAREKQIQTFSFPFHLYVEPVRNFGIEKAPGDWVFLLDADERITPELAVEIKQAIENTQHSFFKVPRKNIFARTKWLQYGGWWPDYQIRLINKHQFKNWPAQIHSTPQIEGTYGLLNNPLTHYFHGDLEQMVEKTIVFENIESDLLFKADKYVSTGTFFRKYFGELFRRLIKNQGFRDGAIGIIESFYQAFSKTITYLYLYEKKKGRSL